MCDKIRSLKSAPSTQSPFSLRRLQSIADTVGSTSVVYASLVGACDVKSETYKNPATSPNHTRVRIRARTPRFSRFILWFNSSKTSCRLEEQQHPRNLLAAFVRSSSGSSARSRAPELLDLLARESHVSSSGVLTRQPM